MISEEMNEKISLATVYNTVHAFEKKGYLKEILTLVLQMDQMLILLIISQDQQPLQSQ